MPRPSQSLFVSVVHCCDLPGGVAFHPSSSANAVPLFRNVLPTLRRWFVPRVVHVVGTPCVWLMARVLFSNVEFKTCTREFPSNLAAVSVWLRKVEFCTLTNRAVKMPTVLPSKTQFVT